MQIGLAYDLRDDYLAKGLSEEETAEFDRPETIQALEDSLRAMGHQVDRVGNLESLMGRLLAGDRWDLVFNIAEGLYGLGREAQVPALLDGWRIPYVFSDPLVLSLTLHKAMAKRVVRDAGLATAPFFLVETPEDIRRVDLPYPLFAKPVAEGTGKGVTPASKAADPGQLDSVCRDLLGRFRQPVLVETFLPGREFTVGLVGTGPKARVLGVLEVLLSPEAEQGVYSFHNKEHYENLVEYRLLEGPQVEEINRISLAAWRVLGCRDAGRMDIRLDGSGNPHFLEVNPLAGIHPLRSDLAILCAHKGIPYPQLIRWIVESALERLDG
ncbi:MAG: D-alanine--D-alanine ligase [Deltaproteobacteria bacterium]|nr:D-alanine--D-alanine ligase [Deltaproteobacteria bacterium]